MNADEFNARYPVGTPVLAYPGFRPEDASDARRLVTRTRTKAQLSASGDPVVWVEGEGSYICLTHVDPVSESVWQAAKQAEETAAAVATPSALPVPVGDQPQPLDDARLAEIRSLLRYETSISFHSARAKESMLLLLSEVEQWRATYGADALPGALKQLRDAETEVHRLKAELAAEKSAHRFTLRQRNNRSNRITHLRDLANAAATGGTADVQALIDAARDTLAASVDDHKACTAAPTTDRAEEAAS
ncbi:hypothetical protein [Streptomyces bullii]|uniref:Uncharacterized protein n=1 Tax=Streptomyces bullii TaxID=349910 RepID=A0ABW0UNS8_9ACTN